MKTIEKDNSQKSEASYPLYDFAEAVKIAEAVRDLGGGNAPVARSLLAQHLQLAETGPSFFQRVSSSKSFGMIDGRGAYTLTDISRQYFYPTSENGKEVASVKALTFPKAFSILVQKFDGGKLPLVDMVGNIIHAEADIPVSKKNVVAGIFLRSIQTIGVVDPGGFLRCKAHVAAGMRRVLQAPPLAPAPTAEQEYSNAAAEGRAPKEFTLNEKRSTFLDKDRAREVTLDCPFSLTQAEYNRICNWIKATWIVEEEPKT